MKCAFLLQLKLPSRLSPQKPERWYLWPEYIGLLGEVIECSRKEIITITTFKCNCSSGDYLAN